MQHEYLRRKILTACYKLTLFKDAGKPDEI